MSQPRYRAFLSYSHRDKDIGEAIHRALETYTVPRDLVGKKADHGEIPAKLHPVFRDRYDLEAGHSLHHQVSEALRASDALIVLCSPASAKSKYVGGEIRAFKAMGRAERIYPVIIGGEPGDPERECFNPALRFKVDADGQLTNEPEEPLAADWRAEGDGPDLAKLKLIAGLIGVDLDHLRRREAEEQKRQKRRWMAVAASMAGLAVVAGVAFVVAFRESRRNEKMLDRTIKTTASLIQTAVSTGGEFGVPTRVSLKFLKEADGIFQHMEELKMRSAKLKHWRAELMMSFSESFAKVGRVGDQLQAAQTAVDLARSLAEGNDDKESYQALLCQAYLRLGKAYSARREMLLAIDAFSRALGTHEAKLGGQKTAVPESLEILSDIYQSISLARYRRDDFIAATRSAETALAVVERLGEVAGADRAADRLISAMIALADLRRAQKQPREALELVDRAFAVAESGAQRNPEQVVWRQRLATLHLLKGDAQSATGDATGALSSYRATFAIRASLNQADPQNRFTAQELAFAHVKIGEAHRSRGELAAAEMSFLAARDVFEDLIKPDTENASPARLLVHALEGYADILRRTRRHADARPVHERIMQLATEVLAADPENRDSLRLVSKTLLAQATNLIALKADDAAYELLERAISLRRPLTDATLTESAKSQLINDERGLAEGLEKSGDIEVRRKNDPRALAFFDEALALRRRHRSELPDDATIAQRFATTLERKGAALVRLNQTQVGLALFKEAIADRKTQSTSNEIRKQLATLFERVALVHGKAGERKDALAAYRQSLSLRREVFEAIKTKKDEEAADAARDVGETLLFITLTSEADGQCVEAAAAIVEAQRQFEHALTLQPGKAAVLAQVAEVAELAKRIATACGSNTASARPATDIPATDKQPAATDQQ